MRLAHYRLGTLFAVLFLVGLVSTSFAQSQEAQPFTLQPGGTATITFEAYCVEFGKFFPQAIKEPNGLAPDNVRAALAYVQQKGFSADTQQALEANFAIWQLAGATRATGGGAVTQEVKDNAKAPPADPQGTSLLDAAPAGQVKLTLTAWQPIGEKVQILSATDNFYGRGTLTVENTSQQNLDLYLPVGTLFPAAETRFQTMGGYATDIQVNNPAPTQMPTTGGSHGDMTVLLLVALGMLAAGALLFLRHRTAA